MNFILEDYHTHSELCHHAIGTIEDYVKKAIEFNLKTIGICDHFPYEFLKNIERIPYGEYAITVEEIDDYLATGESLQSKYKEKINVRIGFEVDFFENQEPALNIHLNKIKSRLDYILGSIHILNFKDSRGAWGFDDNRFREDYEFYGPDEVYMIYYKTEQDMLNSKLFDLDVIGHFDLPKKFNDFPNEKETVFNEAMRTLELIKKKGVAMEVNTSGLRKDVKEQYPSEELLKEILGLDIPILLGSDAHDPNEVAWEFELIIKLLKRIGFNKLAHFNKRKRTFIDI
jgi:histidinol-phosphatase (PHP family)